MKINIFFSIIVLNYQGEKVIQRTIDSLLEQTYKKNFEIIVVDNNSKDNSKRILEQYQNNQKIRIIYNESNLGFAKGNNIGIKLAKGKYICLLNNDCITEKDWLLQLEKAFISNIKIFSISSKVLLFPQYNKIKSPIKPSNIKKVIVKNSQLCAFGNNNHTPTTYEIENGNAYIDLPFYPGLEEKLQIEIETYSKDIKTIDILSKPNTKPCNKIQNAGIIPFDSGHCRDIGAKIVYSQQFYENDEGQYEIFRPVFASCGAAISFRKSILDKIGYLDENFFMYYEDVEICERAYLSGYLNYYCPTAVVRHLHAYSSKEWSSFFVQNVEKGRLLHLFYHWPFVIFIKEYTILFLKNTCKLNYQIVKMQLLFLLNLPKYLLQKYKYQSNYIISNSIFYKQIQRGYWYDK